jgi:carbonic anhydrase
VHLKVDWAIDFPAAKGNHQSPVDIITNKAIFSQDLSNNPIVLNYQENCFEDIKNNGHTFLVTGSSLSSSGK